MCVLLVMAGCWLLAVMSEVGGKMEEEEEVTGRSSNSSAVDVRLGE